MGARSYTPAWPPATVVSALLPVSALHLLHMLCVAGLLPLSHHLGCFELQRSHCRPILFHAFVVPRFEREVLGGRIWHPDCQAAAGDIAEEIPLQVRWVCGASKAGCGD